MAHASSKMTAALDPVVVPGLMVVPELPVRVIVPHGGLGARFERADQTTSSPVLLLTVADGLRLVVADISVSPEILPTPEYTSQNTVPTPSAEGLPQRVVLVRASV